MSSELPARYAPASAPAPTSSVLPHVSLLIPLNTGTTYTFQARDAARKADAAKRARGDRQPATDNEINAEIQRQWGKAFDARQGWNVNQLPREFSKPLGWIARLALDPSLGSELWNVLQEISWIDSRSATGEIIFFPVGVGVLVLRAELRGASAQALAAYRSPAERTHFRERFAPLLGHGALAYNEALKTAAKRPERERTVYELPHVNVGTAPIREARYSHPVVFTSQADYDALRKLDLEQAGRPMDEHSYSDGRSSATLHVGWAESYITGAWLDLRQAIETDFVIAMASWYALVLMNRIVSLYLLEGFTDLSAKRPRIRRKESRIIRLTYMDTANASHPIRWTTRYRDLLLLECIHARWSSGRWWKNVEERTELLALHYDQLEAEGSQRRNSWVGFFGIVIACLTLASATADVLSLFHQGNPYRFWSLGIPALAALCLWGAWKYLRRGE